MTTEHRTATGVPSPPGATWNRAQTNFAIYSRAATGMELLLYRRASDDAPFQVIRLDPRVHRHAFHWHVGVAKLPAGTLYNWRVTMPGGAAGDGSGAVRHEVLDPLARAVSPARWSRRDWRPGGPLGYRGVVTRNAPTRTVRASEPRPVESAVIYELHVRGYTRHPSSGVAHAGTFTGLVEKIPYLLDLGITHVQLLPVAAFDAQDVPEGVADRGLPNYWGYSPVALASPHPGYCATPDAADAVEEFRNMVRAFHDAGLGVLLDVVLNHTAEGGAAGPVISFKGVLPDVFYHQDSNGFRDYTGCGNTINCNHPVVSRLLLDALTVWVRELGVDGFRFDLASVFVRGTDGAPMAEPSFPWMVEAAFPDTTLIAEPWDAAGLYHVGNFPGHSWAEWNGRYRDTLRRFLRGDTGLAGEMATCLAGSSDLYAASDRSPAHSINYLTAHDGFTLADLVSYREKHNEANGEANRDGWDNNLSWNCGTEGDTLDEAILTRRAQDARNGIALLLLSQGVPMLLAGDEVLRTQQGNNNAWCQDNEISWFDWRLTTANGDMLRFVREMIALRRRHPCLSRPRFLTGEADPATGLPDIAWQGREPGRLPWEDPDGRFIAFTLAGFGPGEGPLQVLVNMSDRSEPVGLPVLRGWTWHLAVDTARASPLDIVPPPDQAPFTEPQYRSQPRSVVVLEGRVPPRPSPIP